MSRYGNLLSPVLPPRRQSSTSSAHSRISVEQKNGHPEIQDPIRHVQQLHPYYRTLSPSLQAKFRDFDLDATYAAAEDAVLQKDTHNFVVDFGKSNAYIAMDVGLTQEDDINGLLGSSSTGDDGRPRELRTRWICILAPHRQPDLVQTIGRKYGLSPRHISLLLSQPPDSVNNSPIVRSPSRLRRAGEKMAEKIAHARKSMEKVNDLEIGEEVSETNGSIRSENPSCYENAAAHEQNTSYMSLVSKVWHWHAVEWGGRFLCIGYNSIHNLPTSTDSESPIEATDTASGYSSKEGSALWSSISSGKAEDESLSEVGASAPEGLRLWTWVILCDDGTIISLHEPHTHRPYPSPLEQKSQLSIVRRNILTIFRSLSRAPIALSISHLEKHKGGLGALDVLPFRQPELEGVPPDSEPSLLFYYLFDDWYTSWSLAIERRHPYTRRMRKLKADLIRDPELKHVDSLLHLARQLAVLKRMYETYVLIIDRILYRQENSLSMSKGGGKIVILNPDPHANGTSSSLSGTKESTIILGDPKILGVPLSPLAVARFERLRDRIKLYALAEIQDCLEEKDGLVSMTFQLIAFKQTSAVERLTRVAILFAGATILFLPLTLITGFFSMTISGWEGRWKEGHFWGASGMGFVITAILLIGVIKYSDAMEKMRSTTQRARVAGHAHGWFGLKSKQA